MAVADPASVIPDEDGLFRRIHEAQMNFLTGKPQSSAFDKPRLSVNWEKHSTPEETAKRDKNPSKIAAVAVVQAGACRQLGQTVEHTPMDDGCGFNEAHADICGKKTGSIQRKLRDSSRIVWQRNDSSSSSAQVSVS
jgi:hypothetical protein